MRKWASCWGITSYQYDLLFCTGQEKRGPFSVGIRVVIAASYEKITSSKAGDTCVKSETIQHPQKIPGFLKLKKKKYESSFISHSQLYFFAFLST